MESFLPSSLGRRNKRDIKIAFFLLLSFSILELILAIAFRDNLWKKTAIAFIVIENLVCFMTYGIDKQKSKNESDRIPEFRLHLLLWMTGVVGGWVGMLVFRHKTKKWEFLSWSIGLSVFNLLWIFLAILFKF